MIQAPRKSVRWLVLGYEQRFIADTLRVVDSLETLATSEAFLSSGTARQPLPPAIRSRHG